MNQTLCLYLSIFLPLKYKLQTCQVRGKEILARNGDPFLSDWEVREINQGP